MNEGEAKTFTVCDSCWTNHYGTMMDKVDELATLNLQLAVAEARLREAEGELELSRSTLEMTGRCDRCGVQWNPANYGVCPVCTMDMANDALHTRVSALEAALRGVVPPKGAMWPGAYYTAVISQGWIDGARALLGARTEDGSCS
jgi:hypothetical protein